MRIKSATFVKGITGDDEVLHDGKRQVAFVGRSNVGKSSLINSLLNVRDLAYAGKKQGKTREINFFLVNEKYYFVDLPGYGFAQGGHDDREIIRGRIIHYLTRPDAQLHTVVVVLDGKVGITDFDRDMVDILFHNQHHFVFIMNKSDKLNQKEYGAALKAIQDEFPGITVLPYSSKLNKGAGLVLQHIAE